MHEAANGQASYPVRRVSRDCERAGRPLNEAMHSEHVVLGSKIIIERSASCAVLTRLGAYAML